MPNNGNWIKLENKDYYLFYIHKYSNKCLIVERPKREIGKSNYGQKVKYEVSLLSDNLTKNKTFMENFMTWSCLRSNIHRLKKKAELM